MPPIFYPDINGNRTSFCSIELGFTGIPVKGIKSINYREKHDIPAIYGTSAKPIGRTRGRVSFEGDIEFYQAEWNSLLPFLTLAGAFGFAELSRVLTIVYAEKLSPQHTVTDVIVGARLNSPDSSNSEGTEASTIKCSISMMDIKWAKGFQGLRNFPI
jgi:hypothetical protein